MVRPLRSNDAPAVAPFKADMGDTEGRLVGGYI